MSGEQEFDQPRKAVWPPPRRGLAVVGVPASPPVQVVAPQPEPPPAMLISQGRKAGLLNSRLHVPWEDKLVGAEYDKWRKAEAIIDTASPEFKAAMLNRILGSLIDTAKRKRQEAEENGEKFKKDLIDRNVASLSAEIETLDGIFCESVCALDSLSEASDKILESSGKMKATLTVLQADILRLQTVQGPWSNAAEGAEYGRGITGYDTPKNVERIGSEHRKRWEEKHAPKIQAIPQEPPKADTQPAPLPAGVMGPLFGRSGS
jgi:hypothetical protein